jgi:hypothetical protein
LADLAQEVATAKEETDTVVQDFIDTRDNLQDQIDARTETFESLLENIDTLGHKAGQETDAKKKAQAEAVWKAALNNFEGLVTQNRTD